MIVARELEPVSAGPHEVRLIALGPFRLENPLQVVQGDPEVVGRISGLGPQLLADRFAPGTASGNQVAEQLADPLPAKLRMTERHPVAPELQRSQDTDPELERGNGRQLLRQALRRSS